MTIIIDDQSVPGAYADKFKDAPYYQRFERIRAESYGCQHAICVFPDGGNCECLEQARAEYEAKPRCYRDRKAKERLKDTTNAIRAKLGMELL